MICAMLVTMVVTAFAQKIDYTTYDVLAKAGNANVLVKDNDYRMVVGSLKKPKTTFLLGYSKEQAVQKFERLLEITSKKIYSKEHRHVNFCSVGFYMSNKGKGDNERYLFEKDGERVKFELSKEDVLTFKKSIEA